MARAWPRAAQHNILYSSCIKILQFIFFVFSCRDMAKARPKLPEGWNIDTFVVAKMLAQNAKVLFIYNDDFNRLRQINNIINLDVTIMSDDMQVLERARASGFAIIRGNINAGALEDLEPKSFNFIVAEDVLVTARYPGDFLSSAMRVADKVILGNKNKGNWRNRIKFLFSGSFYVHRQYDIVPDDAHAWFNKNPWILSHKDVMNLCVSQGLTISNGVIIYRNGVIDNIYDIRSYPNMNADYVYYSVTADSSLEPSAKLGGMKAI